MPYIDDAGTIQQLREEQEDKMCIYCGQPVSVNLVEQFEHLESIHIIKSRSLRNVMVRTAFIKMRKLTA